MNKIFLYLRNISASMLAAGMVLPFFSVHLPVTVWDILQIGGMAGLVLFGFAHHFTMSK